MGIFDNKEEAEEEDMLDNEGFYKKFKEEIMR
jgi:hypothetical protein